MSKEITIFAIPNKNGADGHAAWTCSVIIPQNNGKKNICRNR